MPGKVSGDAQLRGGAVRGVAFIDRESDLSDLRDFANPGPRPHGV